MDRVSIGRFVPPRSYDRMCECDLRYLVWPLPLQSELAWRFAAGVLAAVKVHAPGAAEGEGRTARVGVLALTRTRSTEGGDSEKS